MAESALLLRCKSGSSYAESNNKCIAGERRAKGFVATDYTLHTLREMHSKSVEEERRKEGWVSAVVDGGTYNPRAYMCIWKGRALLLIPSFESCLVRFVFAWRISRYTHKVLTP